MKNRNFALIAAAILLLVIVFMLGSPFYVVDEREQVVVTRFNRPVRIIVGARETGFEELRERIVESTPTDISVAQGAGLYFKMPFIDTPESFPDTLLEYDANPEPIVTKDKKQLTVDTFARWRIEDPLLFRLTVRTVSGARGRLDDIIYSVMREELGKNDLIEIIRTTKIFTDVTTEEELEDETIVINEMMREELTRGREEIMATVTEVADRRAREEFGISVTDVRIKRAELPNENLQAVFGRMRAERERISKGYISEGERQAAIIRGETDRDVRIMLAEAEEKAQKLRGEGDAESIKIIANAFGTNPDFYEYIRSLEVIKDATPKGSEIVIGLDSGLYKLLASEN